MTKLIAVEPNLEMYSFIEESKRSLLPTIEFNLISGIAQELSGIKDSSVDYVTAFHVLCTINDVEVALKEIKRVLKR